MCCNIWVTNYTSSCLRAVMGYELLNSTLKDLEIPVLRRDFSSHPRGHIDMSLRVMTAL